VKWGGGDSRPGVHAINLHTIKARSQSTSSVREEPKGSPIECSDAELKINGMEEKKQKGENGNKLGRGKGQITCRMGGV